MRWVGTEKHPRTPTVASQAFLTDASGQLASLIKHLEATFGDHMIGYHIAGQNTDEWFYQDSWGADWNGYAAADTVAFRKWLAAKYGSDTALRIAWHKDDVSLATAAVPTPDERQAGHSDLRDPAAMQNVIDFTLFQQDSMADCICRLGHVVRQTTLGKKLSVFFYGYAFAFGSAQNGPANSGHYALRRILDSPDIDAIASPWQYGDRGIFGAGPIMVAADTCALAGKLYVAEDDTRTDISGAPDAVDLEGTLKTSADTNNILMRNSAQVALRNLVTWWMDLGSSGWFDDPAYWNALDAFYPVEKSQLSVARPYHPEIALVVDETSVPLLAWHGRAGNLLYESQTVLGRSGAPYGQYLQDDVTAGRVHAKVYVFVSSYRSTAPERAALLKSTHGATRIWCYAPGYFDGGTVSLAAVKDLTAFEVKTVSPDRDWVTPTAAGIKLGLTDPFGVDASLHPTLAVADARGDEALATYPDGSVAVAIRKTSSGTSIFVGTPQLSVQLIRMAARAAGAHLYADNAAAVFANGPFLAVHATRGGPVAIDTGKATEIVDVIGGGRLGKGPKVTIDMSAGDTRVMRY